MKIKGVRSLFWNIDTGELVLYDIGDNIIHREQNVVSLRHAQLTDNAPKLDDIVVKRNARKDLVLIAHFDRNCTIAVAGNTGYTFIR